MTEIPYYPRCRPGRGSHSAVKKDSRRAMQDALTADQGWLDKPRDFQWLDVNIPCQEACPAATDIPAYLDAIARGDYAEAYRINLRDNVFPAVLGRVCTRPCEPVCRHGWEGLGEPVAICFSKRSAADFMKSNDPVVFAPLFTATGKTVAVVGGGAAGLAAAREVALLGHRVTVFEQHEEPGGMMVQGIPAFRLPRAWVRREIKQIELTGVAIRCGVAIGRDITMAELLAGHDAVIVAAGATKPRNLTVPGSALDGVMPGLDYLRRANAENPVATGRRVLVVGGGFTAVDCARMARRLGAETITVAYRRTEQEMYITPGEVEEMQHEGIAFLPQTAVAGFAAVAGTSRVGAVRLVATVPGEPGSDGRRGFVVAAGEGRVLDVDMVLAAIGQECDDAWLVPPENEAARAKLFYAGDFQDGAGSLIDAVASGKRAALEVDEFLTGARRVRELGWVEDAKETGRTRAMDAVPRQPMPALPDDARSREAEVETGFNQDTARVEAQRCYLCHFKYEIDNDLCIYCDRCLKVKPVEGCIVKVSELLHDADGRISGYTPSTSGKDYNMLYIDQSQCIRCGACRDVCPVECISLQKVSRRMAWVVE